MGPGTRTWFLALDREVRGAQGPIVRVLETKAGAASTGQAVSCRQQAPLARGAVPQRLYD